MNELINDIMLLIAQSDHEKALKKIIATLKGERVADRFIQALGNYNGYLRNYTDGLIEDDTFNVKKAGIRASIRIVIEDLPLEFVERIFAALSDEQPAKNRAIPLTLLFAGASPRDQEPVRVAKDAQLLQDVTAHIRETKLTIGQTIYGATFEKFVSEIVSVRPQIVHFSGHGYPGGLIFEDNSGYTKLISADSVERFFKGYPDIKLVFLSACYSVSTSEKLAATKSFAIGYKGLITDQVSQKFISAFYSALAHGEDYLQSYRLAQIIVINEQAPENSIPDLYSAGQKIS